MTTNVNEVIQIRGNTKFVTEHSLEDGHDVTAAPMSEEEAEIAALLDIERNRKEQDFASLDGKFKTKQSLYEVRKPKKAEYLRVHEVHEVPMYMLHYTDESDYKSSGVYVVGSTVKNSGVLFEEELKPFNLVLAINSFGEVFVWPVPGVNGDVRSSRNDGWNASQREIAKIARTKWVSIISGSGRYNFRVAADDMGEPAWPADLDFQKVLNIAFKDRSLLTVDHPILNTLRGAKNRLR